MTESGLHESIINMIQQLNQKSDISPRGLISLLTLVYDSIYNEFGQFAFKIFQNTNLQIFSDLMKENQVIALGEWPVTYGGGVPCVNLMIAQVLRILNLPYTLIVILKRII
jgi:hypothetical protein